MTTNHRFYLFVIKLVFSNSEKREHPEYNGVDPDHYNSDNTLLGGHEIMVA